MHPICWAVVPIMCSTACLVGLIASDPKRHASSRSPGDRTRRSRWLSPRLRSTLAVVALAPPIVLVGSGQSAALLIWLGATSVLGWALVALPPSRI